MSLLGLLGLLACGSEPLPEGPVAEPQGGMSATAVAPEVEQDATAGVGAPSVAVPVELTFYNLTPFYRGLFSTRERVLALGEGLGACLSDNAQVQVSYNNETRIGKVLLKVPPGALTCAAEDIDGGVDLTALQPLAVALAQYRGDIAAKADIRIQSFKLGLSFTRGARTCDVMLGGVLPEDGSRFDPCVSFAGVDRCAAGERDDGVTRLVFSESDAADYVQDCFAR